MRRFPLDLGDSDRQQSSHLWPNSPVSSFQIRTLSQVLLYPRSLEVYYFPRSRNSGRSQIRSLPYCSEQLDLAFHFLDLEPPISKANEGGPYLDQRKCQRVTETVKQVTRQTSAGLSLHPVTWDPGLAFLARSTQGPRVEASDLNTCLLPCSHPSSWSGSMSVTRFEDTPPPKDPYVPQVHRSVSVGKTELDAEHTWFDAELATAVPALRPGVGQ